MARTQSLTVVVTRDVSPRYRGFLASVLSEVAPGVYVAVNVTRGVRDRIWRVIEDWWSADPGGSVLLIAPDPTQPAGFGLAVLGTPPVSLVDIDGVRLARITAQHP